MALVEPVAMEATAVMAVKVLMEPVAVLEAMEALVETQAQAAQARPEMELVDLHQAELCMLQAISI